MGLPRLRVDLPYLDNHLLIARGTVGGCSFQFNRDNPLNVPRTFFIVEGERVPALEPKLDVLVRAGLVEDYRKWDESPKVHYYKLTEGTKPSAIVQMLQTLELWPEIHSFEPDPALLP